jgi:arylsulfatase A-like enzyme/cytochrome c-type biogenesis protein CcmH/NrfG
MYHFSLRSAAPRVTGVTVAGLIGVTALVAAGCRGEARPRHLLLVTLDTLRADRLGSYGHAAARTPHLDALAGRGLRFARAATVTPLTLPAHASLFTGTFPAHHGVRDNGGFYLGEERRTLAEALAAAGFRTGGFVGAFVLDRRWGIAQGFAEYFDDFDLAEFDDAAGMDAVQRPGAAVVDRALEWLAADRRRPFFAWVHLYDPHTPYEAPEPYRSAFPATLAGAYDAEIAAADAQVGRLLEALRADGRLAETLVVVLGDHGEMLGEHREATHGFFVYDAAVRIPLIVAGPGVEPGVAAEQVRIVDVLPTALARLGVSAPPGVQGVDLLAGGAEPRRLLALVESWYPRHHYGWSELVGVQDGRYKLIRAPRRELYDLERDPGERDNLEAREPQRAAALERALDGMLAEVGAPQTAAPRPPDAESAARLRALGYLASAARPDPPGTGAGSRGDPKDKIVLYNLLKEASAAAAIGEVETAIAVLRRALAADPEIVEGHLLLGNFERRARRPQAAIAAYRAALALDGEHQEALHNLALAYKEMGRLDDALAGLERAHALDPRNGKAIWQLADVEMRRRRFDLAEAALLRALELDLDRARFLLKLGECYLEMGRAADAERRLREALAENPRLATAHFSLGLVHEAQGRAAEAVAAYRAELESHADAYRASFNLARLLERSGSREEALALYRRTVEIQPQFGTGHLYLAKALLDRGDLAGAERAARRGLELVPEPGTAPLGHYVLADVYSRLGRPAEAAREAAAGRRLQRAGAAGPS